MKIPIVTRWVGSGTDRETFAIIPACEYRALNQICLKVGEIALKESKKTKIIHGPAVKAEFGKLKVYCIHTERKDKKRKG